jgi:hypothetical protein
MLPVLLLVTTVATFGTVASPRMPDYPHVRASDPRILIEEAARRSLTFAHLYARLQETDIILFVEPTRELKSSLSGRLVFVSATPIVRYLRADIRADLGRTDMISTIAHEMQHALEVADATHVRDEEALAVLYRRIGLGEHGRVFETEIAQVVAERVRKELLA